MFPILYVEHLEVSLRFYRDLLGMRLKFRWPEEGSAEYVYLVRGEYGLGIATRAVAATLLGQTLVPSRSPTFELCLYVDDVDATVEKLRLHGVRELVPPTDRPWGERSAYVADPDGTTIQVTAPISKRV